jgi:hypothetical protein
MDRWPLVSNMTGGFTFTLCFSQAVIFRLTIATLAGAAEQLRDGIIFSGLA